MDKKKKKREKIIKIVLIIIIILLLLHNCYLIKNTMKEEKKPTGNVDVFEIQCDKDSCEVEKDEFTVTTDVSIEENTSISKGVSNNTSKTDVTVNSSENIVDNSSSDDNTKTQTEDEEDSEDGITVKDTNTKWKSTNQLRIFTNPVYNMEEKIAPESSNTYQFVIKNNTNSNVKYNIKFVEQNENNINMKYKLRKGNNYIVGNENTYVSYNDLNQNNIKLNSSNSDTYYLEWKWVSTDNDSQVGSTDGAKYSLSIEIKAESINE